MAISRPRNATHLCIRQSFNQNCILFSIIKTSAPGRKQSFQDFLFGKLHNTLMLQIIPETVTWSGSISMRCQTLWLREQALSRTSFSCLSRASFSCLYRPFVVTWNFIRLANSCDNHCNGGSGCVSCWVYNIVSELISIPYLFCQECKYEIVLVKNWFVMWGKVHQKTRKI